MGEEDSDGYFLFNVELGEVLSASLPFHFFNPPLLGEVRREPVFIDDYAHHPQELKALISGARSLFEKKKLVLVFQPHLFSRTRDLADGFASSLDLADEVILLPIYPARELPIEGVSSEMILNKMKLKNKSIMTKDELINKVSEIVQTSDNEGVVFITAGAGDIDAMLQNLKKKIENK